MLGGWRCLLFLSLVLVFVLILILDLLSSCRHCLSGGIGGADDRNGNVRRDGFRGRFFNRFRWWGGCRCGLVGRCNHIDGGSRLFSNGLGGSNGLVSSLGLSTLSLSLVVIVVVVILLFLVLLVIIFFFLFLLVLLLFYLPCI